MDDLQRYWAQSDARRKDREEMAYVAGYLRSFAKHPHTRLDLLKDLADRLDARLALKVEIPESDND